MIPPRNSGIGADASPLDDGTLRIAVEREFGGDHTIGWDILLHPRLERGEETVLRSVSRPEPLTEVIGLVATPAMPHAREKIELEETAYCLFSRSPAQRRKEIQVGLGAIVSTVIDDDLAAAFLERPKIATDECLETEVCRGRSRHDSIVVRWITLRLHQSLPATV